MAQAAEKQEENHVLLVASSAQGNVNPMVRLGKRLAAKGIHVALATTEVTYYRILKSSGASATDLVSGIKLLCYSDGLSLDYDRVSNLNVYMDSLGKHGPSNLSTLIKEHYTSPKKLLCLITNPFVPWVSDVATEYDIPCAMLWIQPCALYAIYYRFFNKLSAFPTLTDPGIVVELPGLPSMEMEDLPSFVLPNNPFGSFSKLLSQLFQGMEKFKWVLGNSFYELEKHAIDSMCELFPIRVIGPLVPPTLLGQDQKLDVASVGMWKSDETCMEWLNEQPPCSVIYLSFGSIVVLPAKQMEAIATALKNAKRPFLWVVKPTEFPKSDGVGQLPLGFLEETKDQGQVVGWSPQTKVLSHPAIACFITHCGWNSLLETICAGIPLIAYPQWTDQPANAKLIADVFKIGVRIKKEVDGNISSEVIEKCIEDVMIGPVAEQLRKNAMALKAKARQAVAAGGSSDENMQLFMEEIFGYSCQKDDSPNVGNLSHEGQDKVTDGGV
ncbi:UDP-glycosyltransferase 84B1-like [Syzygium oleosum]|uniref:UDP-glycosyltransferase 84B1-like n=1 Tax=Syzygium oleosum TaxID=219896 RepID=UPI0024B9A75E|nr:UDP-glycosyltransferase 84B1-like [Syzygium oleosum]